MTSLCASLNLQRKKLCLQIAVSDSSVNYFTLFNLNLHFVTKAFKQFFLIWDWIDCHLVHVSFVFSCAYRKYSSRTVQYFCGVFECEIQNTSIEKSFFLTTPDQRVPIALFHWKTENCEVGWNFKNMAMIVKFDRNFEKNKIDMVGFRKSLISRTKKKIHQSFSNTSMCRFWNLNSRI